MILVFASLVVMLIMGLPIAYAIGLASSIGILQSYTIPLTLVPQRMYTMLDSFTLLAIPFFILAGDLMAQGGISERLVRFAAALVGNIKGGLGMVVVLSCMMFGAISGSGAAASAAIGSIMIPEMKKAGYDDEFSASITAISGPLGIIIPPSVVMVIYASTANVSIGKLFVAGYIPGVIITAALMVGVYYIATKKKYPKGKKVTGSEIFSAFIDAIFGLLMIVIVMGGILSGLFTATEAACVSILYALFVGFFVYKKLRLNNIPEILFRSAKTSAAIMFCVAVTNILSWYITSQQIPLTISNYLEATVHSPIVILILVNLILLFLGTILDSTPAVILAVPILLPIVQKMGVNPIHFGIITVVNLAIGQSTPPVGITLFVSSSIANVKIPKMIRDCIPFWIISFFVLFILTFVPKLSLFFV